jgi:N4-gp56 family major capsid protein
MAVTTFGDISPRTAAHVVKDLLKRGMPYLIFEKFGQAKPLPGNTGKSIKFRRYFLDTTLDEMGAIFNPKDYFGDDATGQFAPASKLLNEGVTPQAQKLEYADLTATIAQYGDLVTITDVIQDTHEDDVLKEAVEILGEQAAIILEKIRFNVLKAGTNVVYSNGTARSQVNTVFTAAVQRQVTRTLKRQLAKQITGIVKSTPAFGTESIAPAFVAVCHPDLEYDLSRAVGFVPVEKYGSQSPWEGEIGKISNVRYIASTICEPWTGVGACGATGGTNVIQNGSSQAHVYPVLFFARDAYGLVPFKGKNAVTPTVVNPTPSDSDPLAQRGHVGWKAYSTCIILNDAWMARAEVACTADAYLAD